MQDQQELSNINLTKDLNLKVLNAVGKLVEESKSGLITHSEARVALRSMFDSVSGLVSDDVFNLMSEASDEFKNSPSVDFRIKKSNKGEGIVGTIRRCNSENQSIAEFKVTDIRILKFKSIPDGMSVHTYGMFEQDSIMDKL